MSEPVTPLISKIPLYLFVFVLAYFLGYTQCWLVNNKYEGLLEDMTRLAPQLKQTEQMLDARL